MTSYKKRCVTYLSKKYADLLAEDLKKGDKKEAQILREIIIKHYDERANKESKDIRP